MDKETLKIVKKMKEKYKYEKPEDRVSRWVLGTIKWHYDFAYIIGSGALDESRAHKEKFKDLTKDEQEYLIKTCSAAYKPFKKYLLVYVCYLFGAYYENCKKNNIKFEPTGIFLKKQLNNFFKMIEKFYNSPDKEANIWMPLFDNLFEKKDLNINKNFFLAHYPPLENKHLDSIIYWFKDNWITNDAIKAIFDTARNYIHLEDDKNSPFRKITQKNDWENAITFSIDADTKNYKNSVITSKLPLRFTYFIVANSFVDKINDSYLNSKSKKFMWKVEDLISKIIQNGPNLEREVKQFKDLN
tara:strand:+ start:865 stop:1764 length:900 start_codon:yes stop_codon:yes gene_type:complete